MSPQLGGIGPKYQDQTISFRLGEGDTLQKYHLRALHIISGILLLQYETGKTNNLTGKYIMEL